ncbi:MAG: peptidylprolyl isomerase, partial [Deltaproteobacteria bacterium]|nr:peptidylprolyl isomerase [Deltaproteobacteria bacterium]
MGSFFKKGLAAAVFLAMTVQPGYAATTQKKTEPAKTAPVKGTPAEVVLRVDGKEFTRETVDIAVSNLLPMMSYHSSVSEERYKTIQKTAVDSLINNEIIYSKAKNAKDAPPVTRKDIDEEVAKLKKRLPKGKTLDSVLKNSKMTMAELREDFKKNIMISRVNKKKNEEVRKQAAANVDEAYLLDYYTKNIDKFKEPDQIHVRSILLKADPSGGQKVWNEVKKKAQEVTDKARSGEDFAALARKISEDPNAKDGGDMGWAHRGSLFPEIDDAAAKMKVGEISDPVMTIYGYHILKLEGVKPSVQKKFDEINKEK